MCEQVGTLAGWDAQGHPCKYGYPLLVAPRRERHKGALDLKVVAPARAVRSYKRGTSESDDEEMISASNMLIPPLLLFICIRLKNLVILMTKRANVCDLWINTHGAGTHSEDLRAKFISAREPLPRAIARCVSRAIKSSKSDERAARVPSVIECDLYWQPEDCNRAPQGMTMINPTTIAAVMAALSLGASAFA